MMSPTPKHDPTIHLETLPHLTKRQRIKRYLLAGLLAMLPLLVTVYILAWGYRFINGTLGVAIQKTMEQSLGKLPPPPAEASLLHEILVSEAFAGFAALVIFIGALFVVGIVLGTYVGRRLFEAFESRVNQLPIVRIIYPLVRQMTDLFGSGKKRQFGQVVAVEYPRKGVYSIGFLTSRGVDEIRASDGRKMVCVFMPTAPSPVTGFVVFFAEDEVLPLKMTMDEAFKLILSGGVVVPEGPKEIAPAASEDGATSD